MSDLNIQLNLRATDKGLIGTVNKTTKALKSLNSTIEKITTTTSNSSKAMRVFRTQAYALGGALGIFSVFRQYTTIVSGFGQALADLSAITRATGQDLAFYREEAINLGLTTTQSASEIVNAFKLVGSAKPELLENREALASVTRQVLLLAEASGLDMANATNVAVTALNQFGQGADEANRFVNVLAAGAKFGASEIPQMGAALREAGVFAANANVSFEQTNALLQLLAQHGIEGAQAGTALRNVLEILESSGQDELTPTLVGISTALENLKAQQLSTTEITKLFGNENINAAQGLVQLQDQIDPLTSKLTGTDIALEQANIRTNTLSGDLTKLSNVYTTLVASFDSSDGAFSDVVQKLTEMDGVAGENSEIIQQLISSATQLAVVLKGWKAITEISGYITSYTVAAEGATLVTRGLLRALPGIGLALVVTEGMSAYLDYLYEVKKAQEEAAEANRKLVKDLVTHNVKRYRENRPGLERALAGQREVVRTLREDAEKKENTRVKGRLKYTRKEFNDAKAALDAQIFALQSLLEAREILNKADQNSTIVNESENDGPSINRFDEKITEVKDYAGYLNSASRQITKSGQEIDRSNARNRRALNRSLEQPFSNEWLL